MNRPYTAHSPYSLSPTERIPSHRDDGETVDDRDRYDDNEDPDDYDDYDDDGEIEEYYEPIDRRWIWVAGVAGAILLVAVICTVVILGGGDSGSVSTTVAPPVTTSQPAATTSAAPVTTTPSAPPPVASLPPETVTTVTPTASVPPSTTPTQAAPPPAPAPNAITYRVTGNRNLLDLVTVIYTDSQGALQTDVNVALPWSKTVVLDPGVTLSSVTATSLTGQLNCSITDAAGAAIAAQNNNTMITNCTK
jgi:Mycobacterium membrane protein